MALKNRMRAQPGTFWEYRALPRAQRFFHKPLRSRLPRNFHLEIGWKLLYWGEFVAQSGLKTRPTSRPESFFEFLTRSQSGRSLCNWHPVISRLLALIAWSEPFFRA